jgi:hypothetical protein
MIRLIDILVIIFFTWFNHKFLVEPFSIDTKSANVIYMSYIKTGGLQGNNLRLDIYENGKYGIFFNDKLQTAKVLNNQQAKSITNIIKNLENYKHECVENLSPKEAITKSIIVIGPNKIDLGYRLGKCLLPDIYGRVKDDLKVLDSMIYYLNKKI